MDYKKLLRPRYKVIDSYPSMKGEGLEVGSIITCKNYDNDFSEKLWCEMNDTYPHLFKKLEWWEERKIEELPEYIKYWDTSFYFPIDRVCKREDAPFNDDWTSSNFQPATKEEYDIYELKQLERLQE